MFAGKSMKTIAVFTLLLFICFIVSVDFSFAKKETSQEKKKIELKESTSLVEGGKKLIAEGSEGYKVIEKPGKKYKKKKKKFPWLLVIGGTIVTGVVLYFILKKKNKRTPKPPDEEEPPDPTTGSIRVESIPNDALIWLDGSDTGRKTNATLENISPGSHRVNLFKAGYWESETTVQVEVGQEALVSKTLDPTTIEWILIPAGEFMMGEDFVEGTIYDPGPERQPVHAVYLDEYFISKHELTFEEYDRFCEATGKPKPSDNGWGRGRSPVINVSWNDCKAYCDWLSQRQGKDIHLPTEAQWEKAARGTDQRRFPWGDDKPYCQITNYFHCLRRTQPVGSYPNGASPYGLLDMAGNISEYCQDWFGKYYYSVSPYMNPQGPTSGTHRVQRGGCWLSHPNGVLSAARNYNYPFDPNCIGFRIVMEVEQ